jgi:hypothetical protein
MTKLKSPPLSPAAEFLREREKVSGDNSAMAIYELLLSDVPLDKDVRQSIALLILILAQASSIATRTKFNQWKNRVLVELYRVKKGQLMATMSASKADKAIAEEFRTTTTALRKREQRTKRF